MVLAVEGRLNAAEVKRAHPEIGEDVKVMGVRRRSRVALQNMFGDVLDGVPTSRKHHHEPRAPG